MASNPCRDLKAAYAVAVTAHGADSPEAEAARQACIDAGCGDPKDNSGGHGGGGGGDPPGT